MGEQQVVGRAHGGGASCQPGAWRPRWPTKAAQRGFRSRWRSCTRSPRRRATTSANSAKAEAVSRTCQPPAGQGDWAGPSGGASDKGARYRAPAGHRPGAHSDPPAGVHRAPPCGSTRGQAAESGRRCAPGWRSGPGPPASGGSGRRQRRHCCHRRCGRAGRKIVPPTTVRAIGARRAFDLEGRGRGTEVEARRGNGLPGRANRVGVSGLGMRWMDWFSTRSILASAVPNGRSLQYKFERRFPGQTPMGARTKATLSCAKLAPRC